MGQEGYEGTYNPTILEHPTLMEVRNVAGPAPVTGKKWVMINLDTGELKWYKSKRRYSSGGYSFGRRGMSYRGRYY